MFESKAGCPMCGLVSTGSSSQSTTVSSGSSPPSSANSSPSQPQVLWRDENFIAYRETVHPVSSKGHIIIAFNLHVPSIYTLSSSDLPLLVNIRNLSKRLLSDLVRSSLATSRDASLGSSLNTVQVDESEFRIGFITPPFKDNKIPVTDHLHAHAYIAPADLMGWWRGVAFGPLAWYAVDDLVAEIRESVSNNRVKSGYNNRRSAPIDSVPQAGARTGTPDGVEQTAPALTHPEGDNKEDNNVDSTRPQTPAALEQRKQASHFSSPRSDISSLESVA